MKCVYRERCVLDMAISWRSVISSTSSSLPATACLSNLRSDMAADRVFLMSAATALRYSMLRDLAAGDGGSVLCEPDCLMGLQLTSLSVPGACEEDGTTREQDRKISGMLPVSCVLLVLHGERE